jgi:hypothetical protein
MNADVADYADFAVSNGVGSVIQSKPQIVILSEAKDLVFVVL